MLSYPALPPIAGLGLEPVNEVDHVVEPAARARSDTASGNGDGEVALAGAGPTNQHDIALLGDKPAAGQVIDQCLVDRRTVELEVIEVLGERQLGDGELVFDRARLLLVDLGSEQVADDALRLMLAFDGGGHYLVEGGLHTVELEFAHKVEQLGSFHQMVLLRLS